MKIKSKDSHQLPPVIVLAGGMGTRLRSVVSDRPKLLAPIAGKPFLEILLQWLVSQEVSHVIFSLGFESELIISALENSSPFAGLTTSFVVESEPRGTLGGVSLVCEKKGIDECIVINGDTFVDLNLSSFVGYHQGRDQAAIAIVEVENPERYGSVTLKDELYIDTFIEKKQTTARHSWVNAGVYYFNKQAVKSIMSFSSGSIETDYFSDGSVALGYSKFSNTSFIDIGTPESYSGASIFLKDYL